MTGFYGLKNVAIETKRKFLLLLIMMREFVLLSD